MKEVHPFRFFSIAGATLALAALVLAAPIAVTYWQTGLVPRLPTAVLCASLGLAAFGSFLIGIVLDSVSRGRREMKRMAYLHYPSVLEVCRARNGPAHTNSVDDLQVI